MLTFIENYFSHSDARGFINGLVNFGSWQEINYIFSKKNTIRGNHYHKRTKELFYIISGDIEVCVQKVSRQGKLLGAPQKRKVSAGSVFWIEPYTVHTFKVLKAAYWLNALSNKMNKTKPDLYVVN